MDRRSFLQSTAAATAFGLAPRAYAASAGAAPWRVFEVTTRVEVLRPAGHTIVWLPTPLAEGTPWQKPLGNRYKAEGGTAMYGTDLRYGAGIVTAEWAAGTPPVLVLVSRFATRDAQVNLSAPAGAREDADTLRTYLGPTELIPTDGIVRKTALAASRGAKTDVDKARALYDWVCSNTQRDPKTRGCGVGDIRYMLESGNLGGKCADLNALFVGLCRAVGVPARDVYGIRVAKSNLGYKSLGANNDIISKAQHCRAEFYAEGYGWVPADPADVRKVILEEGGGKPANDPMVVAAHKRLFGSWEMNWLAYNFAHDLSLPGATRGKVGFFMYPQCETAEGRVDSLDPDNFKYTITARELAA